MTHNFDYKFTEINHNIIKSHETIEFDDSPQKPVKNLGNFHLGETIAWAFMMLITIGFVLGLAGYIVNKSFNRSLLDEPRKTILLLPKVR